MRDYSPVLPVFYYTIRNWLRRWHKPKKRYLYNTRANHISFTGIGAAPFDPSPNYIYGFKAPHESIENIIESDRRLLADINMSYESLANLIEKIFAEDGDCFKDHTLLRWEHIHSPICPWGDFCTKSCFDASVQLMEVWLCDPRYVRSVQNWYSSLKTVGYPTEILREFVEKGWIMPLSDLHPHLIRKHHFLEGYETPYRINPLKLARFL